MGRRYFVETPICSDHVALTGSEAHHLIHVMRAAIGNEITLFDGSGKEFTGRIDQIKRSQVNVAVTATFVVDRESSRRIVVGVALPKGDRQHWLIEKLTELGAAHVVPLRCTRSVVHPNQRTLEKLKRFVVEASKQCGRNRLMEVSPMTDFATFVDEAPATSLRWLADPTGGVPQATSSPNTDAYLAVGPEGGFSPEERHLANAAGWQTVSLGRRILRVETACLAMTTLVQPIGDQPNTQE